MTVLAKNQVVVAMSGGVDSSVAALLLKEQGLEVIGVAMKTHSSASETSRSKTCCTADDINDARRVCHQIDIPFYPIDFQEEFDQKVIQYFVSEYADGRTPNPCVECNSQLKFNTLLKRARQLGAYYLATGHYIRKSRDRQGKYHLLKAKDAAKDQSYFLFGLGQEQLEHILFPIGKYSKDEVREFARSAGLQTADKPESQEICFVQDDYVSFIEGREPALRDRTGLFVDRLGNQLGEHQGIHAYTVGQRRGLGVSLGERSYVSEIDAEKGQIVLGPKEALLKTGLIAKEVRWIHRDLVSSGAEIEVKLRYRHPGAEATIWLLDDSNVRVNFKKPEGAVTPGQVAVFYQGEEMLGGGWIEKGID